MNRRRRLVTGLSQVAYVGLLATLWGGLAQAPKRTASTKAKAVKNRDVMEDMSCWFRQTKDLMISGSLRGNCGSFKKRTFSVSLLPESGTPYRKTRR